MLRGARAVAALALLFAASPAEAQPRSGELTEADEPLPEGALRVGELQVRSRARQTASEEATFDETARVHARLVTLMRHLSVQRESAESERFEERLSLALQLRSLVKRLVSQRGAPSEGGGGSATESPMPAPPEDVNALTGPNGLAPEPAEWRLPGGNAPRK